MSPNFPAHRPVSDQESLKTLEKISPWFQRKHISFFPQASAKASKQTSKQTNLYVSPPARQPASNATQRNATQRNATQRNATQACKRLGRFFSPVLVPTTTSFLKNFSMYSPSAKGIPTTFFYCLRSDTSLPAEIQQLESGPKGTRRD